MLRCFSGGWLGEGPAAESGSVAPPSLLFLLYLLPFPPFSPLLLLCPLLFLLLLFFFLLLLLLCVVLSIKPRALQVPGKHFISFTALPLKWTHLN